jgi:uncharacterized OB-fold protein
MQAAKIYAYSVLFSSSQDFKDKVPYVAAILERDDGERFASLVDGYKEGTKIAIGQEVVCTGRDAAGKETYAIA